MNGCELVDMPGLVDVAAELKVTDWEVGVYKEVVLDADGFSGPLLRVESLCTKGIVEEMILLLV